MLIYIAITRPRPQGRKSPKHLNTKPSVQTTTHRNPPVNRSPQPPTDKPKAENHKTAAPQRATAHLDGVPFVFVFVFKGPKMYKVELYVARLAWRHKLGLHVVRRTLKFLLLNQNFVSNEILKVN